MWTYRQTTGELLRDGAPVGVGYSGHAEGLNNPELQEAVGVGPIPRGLWAIGAPYHSRRVGPFALPLSPHTETLTYGRSAFLIHGDNRRGDRSASNGCIILPLHLRSLIHVSGDTALEVTL